jgi:AraC-like DNA-binding protein
MARPARSLPPPATPLTPPHLRGGGPTAAAVRGVDWRLWLQGLQLARHRASPVSDADLRRAARLIEQRYEEPLDLTRLAHEALLSRAHFHRRFTATFGETPHEALTRRRIDAARVLLETTDHSVTEVCLAVGFSSLGSFSTLFRRIVGQPPTRYRRRVFAAAELRARPGAMPACFAYRMGGVVLADDGTIQEADRTPR